MSTTTRKPLPIVGPYPTTLPAHPIKLAAHPYLVVASIPNRSTGHPFTAGPPPPMRCGYRSKVCMNHRARKRDGSLHRFCEEHRQRANLNQKNWAHRRFQATQEYSEMQYYQATRAYDTASYFPTTREDGEVQYVPATRDWSEERNPSATTTRPLPSFHEVAAVAHDPRASSAKNLVPRAPRIVLLSRKRAPKPKHYSPDANEGPTVWQTLGLAAFEDRCEYTI